MRKVGAVSPWPFGRPAGRELRLNTMAAQVATSSLLVELRFAPIGVKQTFSLKIELRSSGRRRQRSLMRRKGIENEQNQCC